MSSNAAEDTVEWMLRKMTREETIAGFLRNQANDRLDKEGIDFLIFLNNGLMLPLQVKTSKNNGQQEPALLKEHLRKHPLVKFLITVCVHSHDREKVCRDIEKSISAKIKEAMSRPA